RGSACPGEPRFRAQLPQRRHGSAARRQGRSRARCLHPRDSGQRAIRRANPLREPGGRHGRRTRADRRRGSTAMKEWFQSREPRERIVLAAGVVIAAALIFWRLVWMPLTGGVAELRADLDEKTRLHVDLLRAAAIAPREGPARGSSTQSVLVLVNQMVQGHGLGGAVTRTRLEGTNGVNVTFQNAPFNAVLSWLVALETAHGVSDESASSNGSRQPRRVSRQMRLRRHS